MQDTFLQVFVIALSLLTHPNTDHHIDDWDDALPAGMQDREQVLSREKKKLNQEEALNGHHRLHTQETIDEQSIDLETDSNNNKILERLEDLGLLTKDETMSQVDAQTRAHPDNLIEGKHSTEAAEIQTQIEKTTPKASETNDYIWILWKSISILSFIHFAWKGRQRHTQLNSNATKAFLCMNEYLPSFDSRTLQIFHSRCIQLDSCKKHRQEEFLDGFVDDLLQSIEKVCNENGGMAIGTADLKDLHHVIVPLSPPEPYAFRCLYTDKADDVLLDMKMCGHIELVKHVQIQNGCPCQASDEAEEMVCLLHKDFDRIKVCPAFDKLLCNKDSNYLSKAEVAKWFQSTLRQAWSLIAFKYEFEVSIGNNKMPGAVTVRFRNGEKINFSMNPVIASDSQSYFFMTPCSPKNVDTFWSLSLSKYEDIFFNQISKLLPINSCHMQTLDIMLFLHKRQTMLTGSSALKDWHFKISLMHLLLTKNLSEWRPAFLANRLQDILNFMMYSLKTKKLHYVLIGNPRANSIIQLPAKIAKSNPLNLFHPLEVHKCIYKNALIHFQELLRNAQMLINDYLNLHTPEKKTC